ncbi:MAG: adenylate/guanylate cyclase domain-containing protein [Alphaproteobacteria bacterium]|nr:adenylate/guanylate cyclase domain-containing protein [Alphaproteobacteria bacterium]
MADWLLGQGRLAGDGTVLATELATRLVEVGLPLARMSLALRTLYSQVLATNYLWQRDRGCTRQIDREHGIQFTATYLNSPMRALYEEGRGGRWRLTGADARLEFPVLAEFKEQGLTDYFTMPLRFANGTLCGSTWATDLPDGFSDDDIAKVHQLQNPLSPVIEVQETRRIAATLLDTYLGRATGNRVLAGGIKRGDHDSIRAVLLMADLRGFTRLSDTISRDALIRLLDRYFECAAEAVHRQGGEILKFIGDGVLAIFPVTDDAAAACRAALDAAIGAEAALAALNETRAARGEAPLRFGMALHLGDVFYGNIGAPDRLDFTVIGPAVNLVARIEALNKPLGRTLLVSADFAAAYPRPLLSLGTQVLRGLREPQEVFALPDRDTTRSPALAWVLRTGPT